MHIMFSLGTGDDQRPIDLKFQFPVCPPWALYRMVESSVTPPLRLRAAGTMFLSVYPNVVIGQLAANLLTDKIVHSLVRKINSVESCQTKGEGLSWWRTSTSLGNGTKGTRTRRFSRLSFLILKRLVRSELIWLASRFDWLACRAVHSD